MNALARIDLPDWPRLMREDLAASYLGIGATTLDGLGIEPRRVGRCKLYDRRDLDRWADRLGGQPLTDRAADQAAHDVERQFNERRRRQHTEGGER
jgi:hypothetical protein